MTTFTINELNEVMVFGAPAEAAANTAKLQQPARTGHGMATVSWWQPGTA